MCREWFRYCHTLKGIAAEYDDCPVLCTKRKPKIDPYRSSLCDQCPRKLKHNEFERRTLRIWEEWLDEEAANFDFENLSEHLGYVLTAKRLPEGERDAMTQRYIDLIESEDAHWEKVRPKDDS